MKKSLHWVNIPKFKKDWKKLKDDNDEFRVNPVPSEFVSEI